MKREEQKERAAEEEQKNVEAVPKKAWFKLTKENIFTALAMVMSVIFSIASFIINGIQSGKNYEFQLEMRARQEDWELEQKSQNATPILRCSRSGEPYDYIKTFAPDADDRISGTDGYGYNAVKDFFLENICDNIALFSHIEYAGVAYELVNVNLSAIKGDVIGFSPDNRFIGKQDDNILTIVVMTVYGDYYSYDCLLDFDELDGDGIRYYTATAIGIPQPYDADNDVYRQLIERRHKRD